jgi:hypothetical protein
MNNNNRFNIPNAYQARQFIYVFDKTYFPRDLATFFNGMRASAQFKNRVAGIMALGRRLDGRDGHIRESSEYGRVELSVPKMKILFDNMTKKNMGNVLVTIAKHHEDGRNAIALIRELVERRGISPDAKMSTDEVTLIPQHANGTALHVAKGPQIVDILLRAGANPNARDSEGRTPLFYHTYQPDIVNALLRAGADPYAKDKQGKTVLQYILEKFGNTRVPKVEKTLRSLKNAMKMRSNATSLVLLRKNLPPNIHRNIMRRAFE